MDPHRQAPCSLQWFFLFLWLCLLGSLYFLLHNNQEITPYLIPVWLVAGLGASWSVGRLADSRREGAQSVCLKLRRRRYPILPLLAILLIASFFRLYKVDQWPPGLWVDEAHTAANALVLGGAGMPWASPFQSTPLIMKGWVETSNLYLYLCRLHLAVGGVNYLSIKSFSYVYGILAVAGLYFFLCAAVGPRAAIFAAFLMAVGKWPVAISRWGWDCVFLTAAQLPAWYCLAKGWRTGRGKSFAFAGWWTGLALYSYASSLVLPAAHLLLLLALPFCGGRASSRVRRFRLVLLYLAGFVIAAFPFIIHASQDTDIFLVRIKGASAASGLSQTSEIFQTYSSNLVRHLLMFNVIGDPNVRHGISREPVMDKVTGVLFLVGVLTALLRIRRPLYLSLLLWLIVGLAVGYLSVPIESPQTYRTLLVAPAAFGLAGIGLRSLLQLIRRAFKGFHRAGLRRWLFDSLLFALAL
ncbi:MAG: glycosyltransferase family 39 protein, partial [bacterium]